MCAGGGGGGGGCMLPVYIPSRGVWVWLVNFERLILGMAGENAKNVLDVLYWSSFI